jgi:glycosyltransferase involved in cell wall biosynthesis
VALVEHGIDVARFAGASGAALRHQLGAGARPVIACVSRLAPEKGIDVLVHAHARLGRDALLVLVGDGPEMARCRALAFELGVAERVRFLGLRRDVPALLAACDLAVAPSLAPEGFGLSVVEAMAAGKPVVVSDAGAMPELIDRGRCGTVVPRGDAQALADAIGRLLDGPVFAAELGRAGRQRARERYSLERWLERTAELYASVVPALARLAPASSIRRDAVDYLRTSRAR